MLTDIVFLPAPMRSCCLGHRSRRLEEASARIENDRRMWAAPFGALDTVIEELKRKEKRDGRKKRE
ncbi:hypothetical protein [Caballeronia calidae]|uniref:hypothetical protein n=1 Tax=Caballeronia calidae TaxID=1777139 RepID=UPI001E467004|nr:hypothetical protein [Caballeronia calidae]